MQKKFILNIFCSFLIYALLLHFEIPSFAAQNFVGENSPATNTTIPAATKESEVVNPSKENLPTEPSAEQILKQATATQENSHYTLGVNDVLSITVSRHPEVSGDFYINSEGKIQYEFVGDLKILGMTKDEVKDLVTNSLSKYIVTPDVTVKIIGYNSKVVYVIGEVGAPGKIYMHGDTITVREALLQAGLPLLSASMKKSRLVTPADSGKAERKYVNVEALLYDGDLRENLMMKPGDVLYIPATILTKAMRAINPVAQPIGTAVGTGRTVYPALP